MKVTIRKEVEFVMDIDDDEQEKWELETEDQILNYAISEASYIPLEQWTITDLYAFVQ